MRLIGQIALVLVMFLGAGPSAAQDSQYWTQKYGTRGLLLSGVVIGHGVDLSTTFYNPGGLALLSDSMSVIAVKAYDFSNVKIVDATLTGKDLSEPRNSVLPTFFGGTTPFRLFGSSPLAYSLFPRQLAKFNMNARGILVADALPQAAGPEDVVTEARFEEDLDETWGGVTWSKRIGGRAAIGLSQYVAIRSQRTRRQLTAEALANDSIAGAAVDVRGFSYNDIRAVTKLGLVLEFSSLKAGLAITSPGVHISGSADVGWNRFRDGIDVDNDGNLDNELIASFQEGVPVKFRSPPAIGAGLSFDTHSTTIHLSAEAFGSQDRYSVFELAPATELGSGQSVAFQFYDERESVLNYGVGVEHHTGPVSALFASFSSDITANPHATSDLAFGDWDSYLITAGMIFPIGRTEFTLGLGYGFGSGDAERFKRLDDSAATGTILGTDFDQAETRYQNFRLIVGFTI